MFYVPAFNGELVMNTDITAPSTKILKYVHVMSLCVAFRAEHKPAVIILEPFFHIMVMMKVLMMCITIAS